MSDSESQSDSPPRKKTVRKSKHFEGKWQADWAKFRLQPSKKGKTFTFSARCAIVISPWLVEESTK